MSADPPHLIASSALWPVIREFVDSLRCLPCWTVGMGMVVLTGLLANKAYVRGRRDRMKDLRRRREEVTERAARMAAGVPTARDVENLIYEEWGVGPVLVGPYWTEENGLIPYTDGRLVRLAVREPTEYGEGRGTHSPAVIARWVLEEADPMLLVRAVCAHLPDATLSAYLDGDTDRGTLEILAALRIPSERRAPSAT